MALDPVRGAALRLWQFPVITVHSTDNVTRGKTGSFVLAMKPALMLGGTYVNFKVSGTAIAGVDYVLLVSPAYIGQSGYGVIQVKTLRDPRGSSFRQAYSVMVTLEAWRRICSRRKLAQPQCGLNLRFSRQTVVKLAVHEPRATLSPRTFRGSVASRLEPSPGDESAVSPLQLFNASTV